MCKTCLGQVTNDGRAVVCLFVFISTFNIAHVCHHRLSQPLARRRKGGDACQSTETGWCRAILVLPRGVLASSHGRKPVVSALFVWGSLESSLWQYGPHLLPSVAQLSGSRTMLCCSLRMPNPGFSARSDSFPIQNKTLKHAISIQIQHKGST